MDLLSLTKTIERFYNYPGLFLMPHHKVRTGFNCIMRMDSPNPNADIRDDPCHKGAATADQKNWDHNEIKGYLIPQDGSNDLQRKLWIGLASNGEFWFKRDCLEEEINYAISQIR